MDFSQDFLGPHLFWWAPLKSRCRYLVLSVWYKFACQNSKLEREKENGKQCIGSKCDSLIIIVHNVQNSKSSHDSTYKTYIDTRLMEAGMPERWYDVFVGRETCVPANIITRLGPRTLMAELVGPGTAFRCFNLWIQRQTALNCVNC